jgi:hypothetical protein
MGESGLVPEQVLDLLAHRIQLLRRERPDAAAALTGEELSFAAADQLVQTRPVSKVNVPSEPVLLERLEVAIHRGHVQVQGGGNVLRRDRPVRREQRFQYEPARCGQSQATGPQRLDRVSEAAECQPGGVRSVGRDRSSVAQLLAAWVCF